MSEAEIHLVPPTAAELQQFISPLLLDQHSYHLKDSLRMPVRSLLPREANLPACHCHMHTNKGGKKKRSTNFTGTSVINSSPRKHMGTELNKGYL